MRNRKKPTRVSLFVWIAIILAGLALLAGALGVGSIIEPAIFNAP